MPERSEVQKRADKKYNEKVKNNYKKFQTTFTADELEHITNVLDAHGIGNAELIRRAVARLEAGKDL